MSAPSLCPAACVCDVMNKAGMYGRSVYHIMSQLFCAPHWWRVNKHGYVLGNSNMKQKRVLWWCKYWRKKQPTCVACRWKFLYHVTELVPFVYQFLLTASELCAQCDGVRETASVSPIVDGRDACWAAGVANPRCCSGVLGKHSGQGPAEMTPY